MDTTKPKGVRALPPLNTHEYKPLDVRPNPRGVRPRRPTEDVVRRLCEALMMGQSLNEIDRDPTMPTKRRVTQWLSDPAYANFRERYYNARRIQAELRIDEIFDIADDSSSDYKPELDDEGNVVRMVPDNEHIQRSRIRIDTRKWFASKMLPRIYGEKVMQELDVSGDLAELLKKASDKDNGLPPPRGKVIDHDG